MSKIEEAAERLAKTKRTREAHDQCLYDFEVGAKWMLDEVCRWIAENVNVADGKGGVESEAKRKRATQTVIDGLHKAMTE